MPDGAPADVESLFDDYRAIAVAIGGAGGDIDAAYAALQEDQPELVARLFNATAHLRGLRLLRRPLRDQRSSRADR